jgi:hypothetical protein
MDADSNDGTVTESLNGETKPDVAKLAQSAIIKQVRETLSSVFVIFSYLASILFLFYVP